MDEHARFKRMEDSTKEDFEIIVPRVVRHAQHLADRVMAHLKLLQGDSSGFPIDRYSHSLQTATLALRDGRDEEYVVCALLHDIGDTLGSYNHQEIAGAILKPFVSEANHWMIDHHAIFQGYNFFHHVGLDRDMRDRFKDHPHYERTAEFIELYDNPAFDSGKEILPIEVFEPMVQRLMAAPRQSIMLPEPAAAAL